MGASSTGTVATKKEVMTLSGESVMLALVDAAEGKLLPPPPGPKYEVRSLTLGCAHTPCKKGRPLNRGCGFYGCVAAVCDNHSWCCTNEWNDDCVAEFLNTCQRRCDCGGVFTDGPPYYPDASPCVSAVYTLGILGGGIGDTYCSETWWDGYCIAETDQVDITAACHPACQ